jgi:formylglycine-generating enzyme required for sulfatase activity
MKHLSIINLISFALLCSFSQNLKSQNSVRTSESNPPIEMKKLPKKARFFTDMVFVPDGSFTLPTNPDVLALPEDTSLIIDNFDKRFSVKGFYISDHEVTNAEYREFVNWVKKREILKVLAPFFPDLYLDKQNKIRTDVELQLNDSAIELLMMSGLYLPELERYYHVPEIDTRKLTYHILVNDQEMNIHIFPDTTVWVNDFKYAFNEPICDHYAWHPAYDKYPVVGVTYYQSLAYCSWLTDRMMEEILVANKVLNEKSWDFNAVTFFDDPKNKAIKERFWIRGFRLPTEAEWVYAAKGVEEFQGNYSVCKMTYYANFGAEKSQHQLILSNSVDDGGFHTLIVKHYKPNSFGLYDMWGNVAEWTSDDYYKELAFKNFDNIAIPQQLTSGVSSKWRQNKDTLIVFNKDYPADSIILAYQQEIMKKYSKNENEYYSKLEKTLNNFQNKLIHNSMVAQQHGSAKVVKGGSWQSSMIYLQPYTKEICSPENSRSTIGFRVVF